VTARPRRTSAPPAGLASDPLDEAMELMHFGFRCVVAGPDRLLATRGYGRVHHRILFVVGRNPGLSVGDLLALLGVTKQAISSPLRRLVEDGLVSAEAAADSKRRKSLVLTSAGTKFERRVSDLQRKRFAEAFARVGAAAERGWREVMDDLAEGGRLRVETLPPA
jgi:DNA-binding MarR family transcriptional regulator